MEPDVRFKFNSILLSERLAYHSKQANRGLDGEDLHTIWWLHALYNREKIDAHQPLPFPIDPASFWKHVLRIEQTLRQMNLAWALPETMPKLILGFLSRKDANDLLHTKPVGTFFIRVSNADPIELVIVVRTTSVVKHKNHKAESLDSLVKELEDESEAIMLLPEEGSCKGTHKSEMIAALRDEGFIKKRNEEYNVFRLHY